MVWQGVSARASRLPIPILRLESKPGINKHPTARKTLGCRIITAGRMLEDCMENQEPRSTSTGNSPGIRGKRAPAFPPTQNTQTTHETCKADEKDPLWAALGATRVVQV